MKVLSLQKRELINLSLVVIITIIFSLFSLSIDFISAVHKYFPLYTTLPISKFIINVIFLWLVVTLGITYQRWREALKKQKELEDIISSINKDVLVVVDRERNIIMCNDSAKRMLGYSVDEVINRKFDLFFCDSYYNLSRKNELYEKLEKDGFYVSVTQGEKKNGEVIPLEVITYNRKNHNGAVMLLRDITERKRTAEALQKVHEELEQKVEDRTAELMKANEQLKLQIEERKQVEEALKRSEERYHDLVEFANIGIIFTEKDKITQVNRKAEEIYGYTKEELINQSPNILSPEKYIKNHQEIWNKILESGEVKKMIFEEEGIKKDGTIFPIEISFSVRKQEDRAIIAVMRDITERKAMEEKLLQSEKLKSLGELAGGVAHDFNNVLAAILGRVQLLKMKIKPQPGEQEKRKSLLELKAGLEVIEKASLDGANTVKRIQEFSRKRADDKDFTRIDINELIDNALEFTRMRWKNETESKGIKVRIKKELSPLKPTLGSSSELREVFTNLINNAIDAMPQGGEIRVKSFMDDTIAVIKIEDTGCGIPKNIKDRIFDPFFTTKGVQSTGLGLSVSYGILNRHNGIIAVDSVENEGTTFTIKLPIRKTSKQKVKEEKVIPLKREQKSAKILVIEDEKDIREILRMILTNDGHYVEVAAGGKEGIKLFEKKEFDLVFTDLGMPVMSGWEVVERIKSINGKVPVALITGWNVPLEGSEINDSGVNLVIHKPFKMEQVLNLVQEGMILRDQLKAV